jgi:hypothetical protein
MFGSHSLNVVPAAHDNTVPAARNQFPIPSAKVIRNPSSGEEHKTSESSAARGNFRAEAEISVPNVRAGVRLPAQT